MSQKIEVGDLVERNGMAFLVLEVGDCEHYGFCLCMPIKYPHRRHWVMAVLLCPLSLPVGGSPKGYPLPITADND